MLLNYPRSPTEKPQNRRPRPQNVTQMNTFATPKQPPDALGSCTIKKKENEHKLSSPGISKMNHILKENAKKGIEKPILETDAKNMQIWTLPDLQNYGFRARGATNFTVSRDTQNRHSK